MENEAELKRTIGLIPSIATVAGTVIGTGVFFKAAAVTEATGTISLALFAWFLAGMITICAGLTSAELAAMFPETGGMIIYIGRTYGNFWGYMAGWAQGFIYFPAVVAAIAIAFATQVINLFGLAATWLVPIAIGVILFALGLNLISAKAAGSITTITLIAKLVPLALLVIFGFFHDTEVTFSLFPMSAAGDHSTVTALSSALLATMFAYEGWLHIGNIAGEMKQPAKDLPRAIVWGIGIVVAVYMLVNAVFLYVLPMDQVIGNLGVASDVANVLFGPMGSKLITIGILISVYGGLNGYIMTGIRIPFTLAERKMLPFWKQMSKLNHAGVPWFSGIVQTVAAIMIVISGQFDAITDMLVFVIWCFYCLTFAGVFVLRKKLPEMHRPYRVPMYPVVPIIALLGGGFIVISTFFSKPLTTLIGLGITAIGVPIYFYLKKKYDLEDMRAY